MSDQAAALRARLRLHCNGGYDPCPGCDPTWGVYCPAIAPLAEEFYLARRREVLVERAKRVEGARR